MLLDGTWVDRSDRIEVHDPQDGALVATVPRASQADMVAAIDAAVQGAETARRLPVFRRMDILRGAADRIEQRQEEVARTIAREGIKTIREARVETSRCVDTLRLSAEEARRMGGETIAFDQREGNQGRFGYWLREPLGIIGAITPFNDPLNLVAHKLGPALAGGNAVILKPDSKTPLSGIGLVQALHDAGAPPGVVQVITGPGEQVAEPLVTDPRVRMISFTGGASVGESIARRAGLKKIAMELGSNCPVIIARDAELDVAVPACVSGAFWAAGQNCLHVQRLLVHQDVYEEFRDRFVAGAEGYTVGSKLDEATDMGPLITEAAAMRVEAMVERAIEADATLLCGGHRNGTFFDPTLLEAVPDTVELSYEEVYGPVTALYRFDDLSEAIARANAVEYGLQAAIFTRSIDVAHRAIAELRYGGVMVNDSTDFRIDAMPFGGTKRSGVGREGVRFAVEEMTEPKVVCFRL